MSVFSSTNQVPPAWTSLIILLVMLTISAQQLDMSAKLQVLSRSRFQFISTLISVYHHWLQIVFYWQWSSLWLGILNLSLIRFLQGWRLSIQILTQFQVDPSSTMCLVPIISVKSSSTHASCFSLDKLTLLEFWVRHEIKTRNFEKILNCSWLCYRLLSVLSFKIWTSSRIFYSQYWNFKENNFGRIFPVQYNTFLLSNTTFPVLISWKRI